MGAHELSNTFSIHTGYTAAAAVEVAHEVARIFDRRLDLDIHDGFEQGRLGLLHRILERLARREFEGQFRRIDIVVRAVVEHHAEIHHGEAGQEAALGGFHNALLHGGDVVLGDGAAEDLVDEFELGAARERFHLDPAVAKLTVTAGLFLMAALDVGVTADGLAVRNFRRPEDYFDAVTLL